MGALSRRQLEDLLCEVEKPVRYIGNEWNAVVREDADYRCALAYPDTYEIGMSHLGFRILYSLLNQKPGVAAERLFAPWPDLEAALRRRSLPLYTLETKRPIGELDLIGFSLQYEMTLTNVLLMLDLGGIPLLAEERGEGDPLIVAGGPVAMNPEPFADFFDLVAIGDGEELFPELIDRQRELRDGGASRREIVEELGRVPGLYAPSCYELEPDPQTGLLFVAGSPSGHPMPIERRLLLDLSRHPFPEDVIVPFCEIVHSRVAVEIMRGCNVGCRFCQAGYIYRPERTRSPEQVVETALASSRTTGFDEVSLTSLNTGEYPEIETVLTKLMDELVPTTTGLSLPSLRASSLRGGILDEIERVRKSGLTIAPEGGTQRMRDVINKNISEEDIENAAEAAFGHGWDLIKLYFMIGQPTENDHDVLGIAETALKVHEIGRKHRGGRARVNLGVSSFVPKPFTPFQWCAMDSAESLRAKQDTIARALGRSRVKFGRHDVGTSLVESAFSRADRRASRVILRAYRDGARFDGWTEHFSETRWRDAFAAEGLDFDEHAHREIPVDSHLPWDHVDIGVRKSFLAKDLEKALAQEVVSICSGADCHGCGTFIKECLTGNASPGRDFPERPPRVPDEPPPRPAAQTWRAIFEKSGWPRFISHLDLLRTLRYAFRRADVPLAHSEGFHPMPKMIFAPPLPLGFEGRGEVMDFVVLEEVGDLGEEELLRRLNGSLPPGLRFHRAWRHDETTPKLSKIINAARYTVTLTDDDVEGIDLDAAVAELLSRETIVIERERKGRRKEVDVRPGLFDLRLRDDGRLEMTLRLIGCGNARPDEIAELLIGRRLPGARHVREQLLSESDGRLVEPLPEREAASAA